MDSPKKASPGTATTRKRLGNIFAVAIALTVLVGPQVIDIAPFRAYGGVVWVKNGVHYLNNAQTTSRISDINAPKEAAIAEEIKVSTPYCNTVEEGFCQIVAGNYTYKTLISEAIPYKPGTPDRKEIYGYCTLCNDGTFSPSCAVGRGACSWHGGVASYGVAKYRTIPGTPAVQAQPAVYSYESKTYKDSLLYWSPAVPSLKTIVGY